MHDYGNKARAISDSLHFVEWQSENDSLGNEAAITGSSCLVARALFDNERKRKGEKEKET